MRTYTIGTGVLLGMVAVTLTASATLAGSDPLHVTTYPPDPAGEVYITGDGSPQAGEDIEAVVRCHGKVDRLGSPVLEIGKLREVNTPAGIPTYVAPATIKADTAPGDYPLTALCDGETLRWTFTVYPADDPYPPASPEVFTIGTAYPGGDIEVAVRCHGKVDRLESPVLEIGKLREVNTPAGIPTYVAPATIKADTAPGDYPLTALCDGETLHWTFTVYPAQGGGVTAR